MVKTNAPLPFMPKAVAITPEAVARACTFDSVLYQADSRGDIAHDNSFILVHGRPTTSECFIKLVSCQD